VISLLWTLTNSTTNLHGRIRHPHHANTRCKTLCLKLGYTSGLLKRAVVSAESKRWHRGHDVDKQLGTTAQGNAARTCWLTAVASMGETLCFSETVPFHLTRGHRLDTEECGTCSGPQAKAGASSRLHMAGNPQRYQKKRKIPLIRRKYVARDVW
jgi:hypothetical protein